MYAGTPCINIDDISQYLIFSHTKRYFVDKYELIHFLFRTNLCSLMRIEYSVPVPDHYTILLQKHASSNLRRNDRSVVTCKRYNRFVSLYRRYHLAAYINMLKCIMHGKKKRYWRDTIRYDVYSSICRVHYRYTGANEQFDRKSPLEMNQSSININEDEMPT